MRLVMISEKSTVRTAAVPRPAVVVGDDEKSTDPANGMRLVDLSALFSTLPGMSETTLTTAVDAAIWVADPTNRHRLESALSEMTSAAVFEFSPERHRLHPPVTAPGKVLCVGLNYRDHAVECGQSIPDRAVWFNKLPTALCGPDDPIVLPPVAEFVDYEAELVVVIGCGGRNIPHDEAMSHVAGYTCGNDVTARDWQFGRPGGQWFAGKTFDTFAPLGPVLVTPDELGDPHDLAIECRVHDEIRQRSRTSQLIFPIDTLIAEISLVCTLCPGDLIYTGTPPGIGYARTPPVPLAVGNVVRIEIERIGVLRNTVADGN